jgi:D-serine dehydratase
MALALQRSLINRNLPMSDATFTADRLTVDDRVRGFPAGHAPLTLDEVRTQGWKPYDGRMSLPLISLDRDAFAGNIALMMAYVRGQKAAIAPHAKTPMSTALASELLDAGAWGTTVADIRQASVMLKAGFKRLILANEIGGLAAARRLAALMAGHLDAELHIFVDSIALVEALHTAWSERPDLPPIGLLVELGAARAGARSAKTARAITNAILERENRSFHLSGIACYEGAAATADPAETAALIAGLLQVTVDVTADIRLRIGRGRPLLVTAGGSVYFDMVVNGLAPAFAEDANATLILRSGAIFFHDHGVYERGLAGLDSRGGLVIDGAVTSASSGFRPALRVWAEVLSRPEPGLAICGMGLRDVAMDQGLPRPLALYRDGGKHGSLEGAKIAKLNDQHAFLTFPDGADVQIGDVIEFGISHPCTCLDRHTLLYGLDDSHVVRAAYLTSFG